MAGHAVAACHSVEQPGSRAASEAKKDPATTPQPPRRASDDDAGAPPTVAVAAPPAPRWGKLADTQGELFTAIEGHCGHLGVSVLTNTTLVHHGLSLAQVSGDTFTKIASKIDVQGVENIQGITGRWPDSAWLSYDNGGRCNFEARALRFNEGSSSWKAGFALGENQGVKGVRPYLNGALALVDCSSCGVTSETCKADTFVAAGMKTPPMTGDGFVVSDFATLPTGEVYALGAVCNDPSVSGCVEQLRWWSPGKKLGWDVVAKTTSTGRGHLLVRSKTEAFVSVDDTFASFDGTQLKKLPPPGKNIGALIDAGADGLWIIVDERGYGGTLRFVRRRPNGAFDDVSPPKSRTNRVPDSIPVGVEMGAPWTIVGEDVYKFENEKWRLVELPKPSFAFSATSYFTPSHILVAAPDDVWITASYFEKQANWNFREVRTALLRTKRMKETLRCQGTDDPVRPPGLSSWPAAANSACKTPFLLLAPVSSTSPKNYDYPQTRAVLRPKVALVDGGSLREIQENGATWIGLVPRSVEDGRTLADVFAKSFPLSRAELLCAEANVTRTIPIETAK